MSNFVLYLKYTPLHSAIHDSENNRRGQVDIRSAAFASCLFLQEVDFPAETAFLPAHSDLFAVCHRCSENSRSAEGIPAGHQPDIALPSLGNARI